MVISFDGKDCMRKTFHDFLKKTDRASINLLFIDRKMSPPRGRVNGRVLIILLAGNSPRHILHIYFYKFSWLELCFDVFVHYLASTIFPRELFLFENLPDGSCMKSDTLFL